MGAERLPGATSGDELLALALSRPNEAMAQARAIIAADHGPLEASVAHQVVGLVLREFGDIGAAIAQLRIARRLAARAGSADREADVLGTLGFALVLAGRTTAGRNALNQAVRQATDSLRGRSLLRRGSCLRLLGDFSAAVDDLNNAIPVLQAAGDQLWEARAFSHRAECGLATGSVRTAAADFLRAEQLFTECGQELESADAIVNRGRVALCVGNLPEALDCFDTGSELHAALGVHDPDVTFHRCATLMAAGLAADAMREADAAIIRLTGDRGQLTMRAELLLVAANCALAAGEPATAIDRAAEAGRLFGRQGRRWWRAHAQLAHVRAVMEAGPVTSALLRDARRCVRDLVGLGSTDLPLARLTVGRAATALATAVTADGAAPVRGRASLLRREADEQLAAAAAGRRHGPALSRAVAWLAEAHRAQAAGDSRRLMRACRRGLEVIDEFRSVFGSSELRAQSTAHGAELAALGQRHAVRLGRPRLILEWSERWRAVALAIPPVRPPDDELLQADLAALRDLAGRLAQSHDQARDQGRALAVAGARQGSDPERPATSLEHERQRLERAVRARAMHAGTGERRADAAAWSRGRAFDLDALLSELGPGRLLELLDVDGDLHALVCGDGQVRRYLVGRTAHAARAVQFARSALRRAAHGPPVSPQDAVVHDWLAKLGGRLDEVLLGEAGSRLGDGNLVIVPPGKLQAVPWGMVPRLSSMAVSVAPSAASWLRARSARPEGADHGGPVVLIRGPGLVSREAEVPRLAADYGAWAAPLGRAAPVELGAGTATVDAVLKAIDGAAIVHIAAHGTFRADSPMFSSIRLDDGPLTVYDLERLRRGPRLLVLSSCDSGVAAPAGADEVVGLASSLIPLGTAGIVASVVPVNDLAVIPLMIALHRELRAGASLAAALRDARQGGQADPVAAATGWSFTYLGS
ncbi:MAG TPA: CHAT domain-containing protein [Trebonia sp.]|nr:CHAT domain-containing protein [Trebonia sp.]